MDKLDNHVKEWLQSTTTSAEPRYRDAKLDDGVAIRMCSLAIGILQFLRSFVVQSDQSEDVQITFQETLTRLQLWRDGFGPTELEEVLNQSQRFRRIVLGHLIAIGHVLMTCISSMNRDEQTIDVRRQVKDMERLIDETRALLGSKTTDSEDEDLQKTSSLLSSDGLQAYVEHTLEEVDHHVRLLMKLLPSLQHFIEFRKTKAENATSEDKKFVASYAALAYINIVREKFPRAESNLVERLGEANWERHLRIRQALEQSKQTDDAEHDVVTAKSMFRPISTFQDSAIGSSIRIPNIPVAASVVSHSSFRTSATEGGAGSRRVPDTPQEVELGIPFACPVCGKVQNDIQNRYQWKIHVFADLGAYVCTFEACQFSLATFPTRQAWAAHEFSYHRTSKIWACEKCHVELSTKKDWKEHTENRHGISHSEDTIQQILLSSERIQDRQCPLCLKVTSGKQREFVSHVGKHMEAIALSSIPQESQDSESDTDSEGKDIHTLSNGEIEVSANARSPTVSDTSYRPKSPAVWTGEKRSRTNKPPSKVKGGLSCKLCSHVSFKDAASLQRHSASAHTKAYVCVFHFAGCTSTFASKNEWKRHVSFQHLNLRTWVCELGSCGGHHSRAGRDVIGGSSVSGTQRILRGSEFNRKDLFTQHLRRMHVPIYVKRKLAGTDAKWEKEIKSLQQSCLRIKRQAPRRLACPSCSTVFEGDGCWDDRMEHVGKHLEGAAMKHLEAADGVEDDHRSTVIDQGNDELLVKWASDEGIIEKKPQGRFRLILGGGASKTDGGSGEIVHLSESEEAEGEGD